MIDSDHLQTDLQRHQPPARHIDYLKRRLHRMVQSVIKQESENESSCPIASTLFNSGQPVFIKWVLFLLCGVIFALFTYQTYERISHYFTYPVDVDVFITRTANQHFPEVTICYEDPAALFKINDTFNMPCKFVDVTVLMKHTVGISTEEIWKTINSSKAIISANEVIGDHIVPLKYTDIALLLGTCTTFRSSGISSLIQKEDHYFHITFRSFWDQCLSPQTMVYIHDWDNNPFLHKEILFPVGLMYEIGLSKRKFFLVNRPGSRCVSSNEVTECMENCFVKFISELGATKCRLPFYPLRMNYISNNCATSNETFHNWKTLVHYTLGAIDNTCDCPRKCEHTEFSEQPNMLFFREKNISDFFIRHGSPYETIIKERLCYGLIALFCDIGGNSGLLVGISVLSLFQMGHTAARLKKKHSQFSMVDPLYKKVLKTYSSWKKQVHTKTQLLGSANHRKVIVLETVVKSTCICLFILASVDRVFLYFQYPLKTVVDVSFNATLERPNIILCPGDQNLMELQNELAMDRNISNPCDINLWELFELPGVNTTHVWPNKEVKSSQELRGKIEVRFFPRIPLFDGRCIDLNDGRFTIPKKSTSIFYSFDPPQCGTNYQKAYIRSSTGTIDYHLYELITHRRQQQMSFAVKEIHIEGAGDDCIGNEENEQCLTKCLNWKLFNQINCRLPYMPETNLPLCRSSSAVRQAHLAFRDLFFTPRSTEDCNCLPKCNTRFLEISHTVHDQSFPYTAFMFGPTHNVVEYYKVQRSYSGVKLFCDIGGLLGSTLGLSVLTFLENILSFVANYVNARKKQKTAAYCKISH